MTSPTSYCTICTWLVSEHLMVVNTVLGWNRESEATNHIVDMRSVRSHGIPNPDAMQLQSSHQLCNETTFNGTPRRNKSTTKGSAEVPRMFQGKCSDPNTATQAPQNAAPHWKSSPPSLDPW